MPHARSESMEEVLCDHDAPVPEEEFEQACAECSSVGDFLPMFCWEDGDHTPEEGPQYDPQSPEFVRPAWVWPDVAVLYFAGDDPNNTRGDDPDWEPDNCAIFHSEWHCGALPVLPLRGFGTIGDVDDGAVESQWAVDHEGQIWCAGLSEDLPYMALCSLEMFLEEAQEHPKTCREVSALVGPVGHWGGPASN
jgi:hypothetical protein